MRVLSTVGTASAVILTAFTPTPLHAQALIQAVVPEGARVEVELLGSLETTAGETGLLLDVGDMVTVRDSRTQVTLACPSGSTNLHLLTGPFRVMIAEPVEAECAIDLLVGQDDVLTEAPTEVNSGGIALENVGTQYRVDVRRGANGLVRSVVVFDGQVRVRAPDRTWGTVASGSAASLPSEATGPPGTTLAIRAIRGREYESSAVAYARYDAEVARTSGLTVSGSLTTDLRALHSRVLRAPKDTLARVDLAKAQIEVQATNQALYNLRSVDLVEQSALQRYQIDPSVLNRGLTTANRGYLESRFRPTFRPVDRRPDLTVSLDGPSRVAPGADIGSRLRVTVTNRGGGTAPGTDATAEGYMVDLVLSRDETLPDGFAGFYPAFREDVLLRGGRLSNTPSVAPGDSVVLSAGTVVLPPDTPPGRYCLGARVDPADRVSEAGEDNNTTCLTVQVVRGEQPPSPTPPRPRR